MRRHTFVAATQGVTMSELAKAHEVLKPLIHVGKVTVRPAQPGEFHAGGSDQEPLSSEQVAVVLHCPDADELVGEISRSLDRAGVQAACRIVLGPKHA
jgi:hypothetical protein